MAFIKWEENFSVGVEELDDQHKKMIDYINDLYTAIKEGRDRKDQEKLLFELAEYARIHLNREEEYFDKYGYPKKEEHKKAHEIHREKIAELEKNKDKALSTEKTAEYLREWWLNHIKVLDKEYQDYLQ